MLDDQKLTGLPHSEYAEKGILGAMIDQPEALAEGVEAIHPNDFFLDSHRRVFLALRTLHSLRQPVDLIMLRTMLEERKELEAVGGAGYLIHLTSGIPQRTSITAWASIIQDKARKREALNLAQSLYSAALDDAEPIGDILDRSLAAIREVAEDNRDLDLQTVGEFIAAQSSPESFFESMSTVGGIKSGFAQLDQILGGGFQPGELIIVAARPSMGKSAWACNVAHHIAVREEQSVALFTLEQRKKAAIRRMLSSASRVEYKDIRKNELRDKDRALILEKQHQLSAAPLYIDDSSDMTVSRIRAKCTRLKNTRGLHLIEVDQLSHVSNADVLTRGMPKHEWVGHQTKGLKRLAQELQVPVVVFNQLGRDVGKRSDPRPKLEDLKESGNIEEDADVVIFLHRPEYYDKSDANLKGKGEMIVAKNREAETGTVDVDYQGRIMRWEDNVVPAAEQASFPAGYYDPPDYLDKDRWGGF